MTAGTRKGVQAVRRAPRPLLGFVRTNNRNTEENTVSDMAKALETQTAFEVSCHHMVIFTPPLPKVGESILCRKCNAYRTIVTKVIEYKIRCIDCQYGRPFGRDLTSANRRASYHARTSGHDVEVRQGETILDTVKGKQTDTVIYL